MSMAVYHSWLFDHREAWQRSISDPRWSYDMPVSRFMAIYGEYRGNPNTAFISSNANVQSVSPTVTHSAPQAPLPPLSATPNPPKATASGGSGPGQILSQNEIDNLLNQMSK